ncbi:MAG: hypothetical protein ACE5H1_12080 [Thermodesulfobacteriota bacterium]
MKKIILAVIVVAVLLIIFFLPDGDDTSEMESVFNQVIIAGEGKNLDGVMDHISLHYRDEYGVTYPVVKNIVKRYFEIYDSFDAGYSDLDVSFNESEKEVNALANLDVYVTGIRSDNSIAIWGNEESPDNVTVTLEKSILGDWKIKSVDGINIEEIGY